MKVIAVNGSPRMGWNTETLLGQALDGARAAGAETEMVHLYSLDYKGCRGCLACKRKESPGIGHCQVRDALKPVLEAIDSADGLILGSPIYLGEITGMMRAFYERLIFQYLSYDDYSRNYFTGKLRTAFIYTMNAPSHTYDELYRRYKNSLAGFFGSSEYMVSCQTLQVNDYSRFHMGMFDEAERRQLREDIFPDDCRKAYELGMRIAGAEV